MNKDFITKLYEQIDLYQEEILTDSDEQSSNEWDDIDDEILRYKINQMNE